MSESHDLPRLQGGTVINGVQFDGSQFRCLGGICGPDPRLFTGSTRALPTISLEDEFTAIMNGSAGSCGVRPTPEDI